MRESLFSSGSLLKYRKYCNSFFNIIKNYKIKNIFLYLIKIIKPKKTLQGREKHLICRAEIALHSIKHYQ